MSENDEISMGNLLHSINNIDERRHREYMAFMDGDDETKRWIATNTLFDLLYGSMSGYLANFAHLTDHNGKQHDTVDVIQEMLGRMEADFQRATGREYHSDYMRHRVIGAPR